jgi:catechol 2,3-dioxygenase-like lactoylglutathione lyase family enzyme
MEEERVEIYPMMLFPTFQVRDVARSVAWYVNVLGISLIYQMPDPQGKPYLAHVRKLKYQDLLLVAQGEDFVAGETGLGMGVTVTFAFPEMVSDGPSSIDAFAEELKDAGAAIVEGPVDRPWNTRELVIADPDGYRLVFTSPRGVEDADFQKTMEHVRSEVFKGK